MPAKVQDLINSINSKNEGKTKVRKTKNNEEYLQMLLAVLTDTDYVAKNLKEIKDGEVIIEDNRIAEGFKKLVVSIFKSTNMTEEEAIDAANSFRLKKEHVKAIVDAVRETDYIVAKECGKKIQLFKKPGFEICMTIEKGKQSTRKNPQDKSCNIVIKERDVVRIRQTLHPFQKEYFRD
jgi:hypothetical protein